MIIRPVENTDITHLAQIYKDVFHVSYAPFMRQDYINTKTIEYANKVWSEKYEDHKSKGNDCLMLAACSEENTCRGFLFAEKTPTSEKANVLMSTLYIDPHWQNQGLGGALVGKLRTWIFKENLNTCGLWVLRDNELAKSFYTKHGFVNTLENKQTQLGQHSYNYEFFKLSI